MTRKPSPRVSAGNGGAGARERFRRAEAKAAAVSLAHALTGLLAWEYNGNSFRKACEGHVLMIPVRLSLRNFMCYRGETGPLDFTGTQLACLTGDNGHGKSALLDAMTWAVWGKARAKRDDELITLGEYEMEVDFEFSLKGNSYRVVRKRDSRKRGQSVLELQGRHGGEWRALTGPTIRETQQTINDILRMDYDTFINSAFLVQGRADEFTIKPPAERKHVLSEILGLGVYDSYEQKARDLARDREMELREASARVQDMDRELASRPHYEEEARDAQLGVQNAAATLAEEQARLDALRKSAQELQLKSRQLEALADRIAAQEEELNDFESQIGACATRLTHCQELLAKRDEIESGFNCLQQARAREQTLGEVLSRLLLLNEQRQTLERIIADAAAELNTQYRLTLQRGAESKLKSERRLELAAKLETARQKLRGFDELDQQREEARAKIRTQSGEVGRLEAMNIQLKDEMEALKGRMDQLKDASAVCPLCGQDLSADHRQRVVSELMEEGTLKGERYRSNKEQIDQARANISALEARIGALDGQLKDRPKWQREEGQLEQGLKEAVGAEEQSLLLSQEAASLKARLDAQDFARLERTELDGVLGKISDLGYEPATHQAVRGQVQDMSHFDADKTELDTALRLIQEDETTLKRLEEAATRARVRLERDRGAHERIAHESGKLPGVVERLQETKRHVDELRRREADARLHLGAARQKLQHCDYITKERETVLQRQQAAAEEKGIYEELRLAFGKRGLQAMIIEAAVPEIEDEANALLARMTDGRMHISFDTQRQTVKGDVVETLDINISDELGPRSYELYSGGEAFRVNFAIRIALSKLLARRAGAQLQTLIIDEGFGTQDAQGRERLIDAINAIKDEFSRILVVTHIEELRDAFPARIDVVKTPQGSEVYIGT